MHDSASDETMTNPQISIQLFGDPQILMSGTPIDVVRRKSRALAFYLAAHTKPIPRAQLLNLFWPEHERAAGQQSLRTTLHGLRRVLGPALLATDNDLAITPTVDVDARVLNAALTSTTNEAALAAALERYRGDFLANLELPENPEFDEWVAAERERYRRLMVRGLTILSARRSAQHDYVPALELLDRALTLDPLQENIQREAMRIAYLSGDRAGAIRRYETLNRLLDDQLGVPPMAETRALYDAIITDTLPQRSTALALPARVEQLPTLPVAPRSTLDGIGELPFVGREAELDLLQELQGGPKLILIEGEPGIGKSCLAEQYIRISGALGLVGAARELEQTLPYHPLIEALRKLLAHADWPVYSRNLDLAPIWRAEITRLLPELLPNGPPPVTADETRLWEAVSQLLQSLARAQSLMLFLDDIQWADTATLGLLAYLARRSSSAPLTLVAAARPTAPRTGLATLMQTLTREGRLMRMPLARLGKDEIRTLANTISPSYPQPLAEWLERGAEGNPYITVELVRYARERRLLAANGTLLPEILSSSPIVPQTVESLIQSRLERLSSPARLMLDIAVACGREFAFEIIARASALSEATVLDGFDELRAARLIEPLPDGHWRFDHSLTMEVAYREVGEPRHRRLHRRVAEALEEVHANQLDQVAGVLAWHLAEAYEEQRAAIFALRAARRAGALAAWQEAITFYRMALVGRSERERLAILLELGETLLHIGDPTTIETYHSAIELAQSLGDHVALDAARLALGRALIQQARYAEVIPLVRQIREQGHPGSAVRAELLWGIALSVEGADLAGASQHLLIAEQLSDVQADPATHSNIVFELGSVRAQQGDLAAAIKYYREALADAERSPSAIHQRILAHNNLAYHLHLLSDPQAEEQAQIGLRLTQEAGILSLQPFLHSTLGEIALAQGDLDRADQEFSEGLALAERLSMPERVAGLTANLGLVAQQRGQTTLAVHRLSAAQAKAEALGLPHMATQIRIWLSPLLPPDEARTTLAIARAVAESSGRRYLLEQISRLEKGVIR